MDREPPEERRVYSPADVAGRLGVSSSGLRRLALIYERVYGDLGRDPKLGRVWSMEAIERLERARRDVQAARAVSVEQALADHRAGLEPERAPAPAGVPTGTTGGTNPLEALVGELRALREAVEEQNRLLEEQGRRLEALEGRGGDRPSPGTPENATTEASPPAPDPATPEHSPEPPVGTLSRLVARFLNRWGT